MAKTHREVLHVRAPIASKRRWKKAAKAEGLKFSEWVRVKLDKEAA